MAPRPRKVRVEFRKNRQARTRRRDLTRDGVQDPDSLEALGQAERLSGKGALTRRRTVLVESAAGESATQRAVDAAGCLRGRVLKSIGGHHCTVQLEDGRRLECAVRQVVRTLARETRNAVVAGDEVLLERDGADTGVVVRVEPRRSVISRGSDRREHVLVANVDQAVIVTSAAEPNLKPALIDRFIVSAEKGGVRPLICISKIDLVDPAQLQPVAGLYARIGYDVVLASARTGQGVARLAELLAGRESVLAGQSGVGKSSLINCIDDSFSLRTNQVSEDSGKGRHTTRVAALLPLRSGGWIVDTPGIRQMQLWDVSPGEVEGYFREFRPFVHLCRFPDCSHTHEETCGIREAVSAGWISGLRYAGYLRIVQGDD